MNLARRKLLMLSAGGGGGSGPLQPQRAERRGYQLTPQFPQTSAGDGLRLESEQMRFVLAVLLLVAFAGCGERQQARQERVYGANAYRLAGDTTAWSNPPFNGDESEWLQEIDARARRQDEYERIR